jgi:hypothetical protein
LGKLPPKNIDSVLDNGRVEEGKDKRQVTYRTLWRTAHAHRAHLSLSPQQDSKPRGMTRALAFQGSALCWTARALLMGAPACLGPVASALAACPLQLDASTAASGLACRVWPLGDARQGPTPLPWFDLHIQCTKWQGRGFTAFRLLFRFRLCFVPTPDSGLIRQYDFDRLAG